MVKEEMADSIKQIARRLSKARSLTLDNVYRRKSSTGSNKQDNDVTSTSYGNRKVSAFQSDLYYQPPEEKPDMLPDKITNWMLSTEFDVKVEKASSVTSEHSQRSNRSPQPGRSPKSDLDCAPFSDPEVLIEHEESNLPDRLKCEVCRSDSLLCEVNWEIKRSDLLLEVEDILIPVERNFITYVSDKFRVFIDGSSDIMNSNTAILPLLNYTVCEIKSVLEYIYNVNEEPVSDENVASLLVLGDDFKVERLIFQCEQHLRNSKTFNPFIMSQLAKRYQLDSLLEYAFSEMSKIDGIEETQEFQLLDAIAQNQILKFVLQRFKKASRTLSQFDVHLCSHHGNDAKNNQCCFRAATYSTEKNRTFLVQMEHPEEKLVQTFEGAFNCGSDSLLSQNQNRKNTNRVYSI